MNHKREQAELLFRLGQFLGPALKMAEDPMQYDADERTRIMARLFAEMPKFINDVRQFSVGEVGHDYQIQFAKVQHAVSLLQQYPSYNQGYEEPDLWKLIQQTAPLLLNTIMAIPVPVDSAIYEARTPFSTYCFVKDLCSTVKTQIVWLDRYFDQTLFHRFFTDTPKTAQVTLVTLPVANLKGKADQQRHAEFMDISKLFATQRGPTGYRLVENGTFHDRWLRCDDRLFTLGGSIKDLSKPFTISKLDFAPDNVKHFDDAVTQGTEVFGPNQPNHP